MSTPHRRHRRLPRDRGSAGHFGNKDELLTAVLAHEMTACAVDVTVQDGDLRDHGRQLIRYHRAHPQMLRLLAWEALELGGSAVPAATDRALKYRERSDALGRVEARTARYLIFFTLALANWAQVMPQLRELILGEDGADEVLDEMTLAAIDGLAASLEARVAVAAG